ncbi:competence protein CoiA [Bacillus sp. Marseille-Q1617]|uniref:competence protein CoiA n=1 Tax=Bacillus sp. Marseille-Q1617 TaxID=2736887 RepID=UPI00158A05D8|nr:competence protein CoiA family protein [Bacillus sp. Marseille-Q1617]
MLTALKDQLPFTTIHHTKEELLKIRKSSPQFLCPYCSSPLVLRVGNIKIPHFAHISKLPCLYESKKETANHVLAKILLYERLSQLFEEVKLEYYVKELHQIPDLLISVKEELVAIEIQCSTIPLSELKDRTEGYRRENIHPLWILTQPVSASSILLKLTSFQQGFIRFSQDLHYFLLHFDPEKKSFTIFPHLTPITKNTFFFTKPFTIPIQRFTLPISILPAEDTTYRLLGSWFQYRTKWMQNKINFTSSRPDRFLADVYEEGDTFLYLPLYIGLPVIPHMNLCKTHPVEWQYYLWKDVFKKHPYFTSEMIHRAFIRRHSKGNIELRAFPLSSGPGTIKLIDDYLKILEKIEVIQNGEGKRYRLSYAWNCPKSFNEFQQHERDFFPKWKHILKKDY